MKDSFQNMRNALTMVWKAKNPFNPYRSVMKAALPLVHPDAYKLFFPFSYIFGMFRDIIHPDVSVGDTRGDAWYRLWSSSIGEILLLCIFGTIFTLIAVLFLKLTGMA